RLRPELLREQHAEREDEATGEEEPDLRETEVGAPAAAPELPFDESRRHEHEVTAGLRRRVRAHEIRRRWDRVTGPEDHLHDHADRGAEHKCRETEADHELHVVVAREPVLETR